MGPNLRRSQAPYVPEIKHATDTSNFDTIDLSAIASRKLKLDELNRTQLEQQQQQQKQKFNIYSNLNASSNASVSLNESTNSSINTSSILVNPIMYEFTFRRFFDEAYSSDSFFRGYNSEEANSFSKFIRNISNEKPHAEEEEEEKVVAVSKNSCDQTEKLIDHTQKIQLKETDLNIEVNKENVAHNNIKYDYENSMKYTGNYENLKHFRVSSKQQQQQAADLDESMNSNHDDEETANTGGKEVQSTAIFV